MTVQPTKKVRKTLTEYLKNKGVNTQRNYRTTIKNFLNVVKFSEISEYIEHIHNADHGGDQLIDDLTSFLEERKKVCASGGTVYGQVMMLVKFFRHNDMVIPEVFTEEFSDDINNVYGDTGEVTEELPFNKEELIRVVNYAPYELKPLIYLMISTGMRPGEVLKLKTSSLNFKTSPVTVTIEKLTTKKKYSRLGFLTPEAEESIRVWLNGDRDRYVQSIRNMVNGFKNDERIFPYSYEAMRLKFIRVLTSLGMNEIDDKTHRHKKHPHLLRKYCRSNMGKNGGSNSEIRTKVIIGHNVDQNDRRYYRDNPDEMRQWFKDHAAKALSLKDTQIIERVPDEVIKVMNSYEDRIKFLESLVLQKSTATP